RAGLDLARGGIAGMEFGIGIPGTCGASVRGNAGAFGTEIKDVILECDVLDPAGDPSTLAAADCGFVYRRSRLVDDLAGRVVVAARLGGGRGRATGCAGEPGPCASTVAAR